MISQQRQQRFIRKAGGISVLFKNEFKNTIHQIKTTCDYILWVKLDKLIFNTDEDVLLGILYIPPTQSRFLNDDEYLTLETEITSMCSQSKYVCFTGDMNARTGNLCDFVTADSFIADLLDFDDETMLFF